MRSEIGQTTPREGLFFGGSMKIKVYELLAAYPEFVAILNESIPQANSAELLTTRAVVYTRRLVRRLAADFEEYSKARNDVAKDCGAEPDETGAWSLTGEPLKAFMEKWSPMAEEEIEVDAFLLELGLFEGTHFSDRRIAAIEPFIKEE